MSHGAAPAPRNACWHLAEYVDIRGRNAWAEFWEGLSPTAAAKVWRVLERLAQGHSAGLKAVGSGVAEWRIDWGPGIRVYLHQDGQQLILLLGGSYGKDRQATEIASAKALTAEYRQRKRSGVSI